MSDRPDKPPEMGVLAAEYVLGLMSSEARAAFAARLSQEPELLSEVRGWEAHFAAMAEHEVDDVMPPARVERAVKATLFGADASTSEHGVTAIWERLAFWRGLAFASSAVAILAIGSALLPDGPGSVPDGADGSGIPAGTILMTHLIPTEGSTLGLAVTREPSGQLQVRRVAGEMVQGRAREMWLIVGDNPPVSLGLLGEDPLTTITPPSDVAALFAVGATLAISDEPPGGSPTGAPTGSVLAVGSLVAL